MCIYMLTRVILDTVHRGGIYSLRGVRHGCYVLIVQMVARCLRKKSSSRLCFISQTIRSGNNLGLPFVFSSFFSLFYLFPIRYVYFQIE
jgi:hypothetical protein